jgi:hypothetical protein
MAQIVAVCKSEKKGIKKTPQPTIILKKDYGVVGDVHTDCAVRKEMGDCIMPREGVFTKVIRGGTIRPGDSLKIIDDKARTRNNNAK